MTTIRVKHDGKYFAVSNALFNDDRLSWEARGLMGYLLSKPDDWQVRVFDLKKRGPAKRQKIQRMLRELEGAGYLKREVARLKDGRFDWISTIYETPRIPGGDTTMTRKAVHGQPGDGRSDDGQMPHIAITDPLSTDSLNTEAANTEVAASRVISEFQKAFPHRSTRSDTARLERLEAQYGEEWVMLAIVESWTRNPQSPLNYIATILKRWASDGPPLEGDRPDKDEVIRLAREGSDLGQAEKTDFWSKLLDQQRATRP